MFRRKFIRLGTSLLMILALTLPVSTLNVPVASAAHTVADITPITGGTGGGTLVTINGVGFVANGVDQVCFGASATALAPSAACTSVPGAALGTGLVIVSDTQLTVLT